MSSIEPPIIIADGGDVLFFANAKDAESSLEPIDVKSGVYEAYDSTGMPLALRIMGRRVQVTIAHGTKGNPGGLKRLLIEYLNATGTSASETMELATLVDLCAKHVYEPPRSLKDWLLGRRGRPS